MGKASRILKPASRINRDAFAQAVKTVTIATSPRPLQDCQVVAYTARNALKRLGVSAQIAAGYAAWRVDERDAGSIVAHHPNIQATVAGKYEGAIVMDGHCWLSLNSSILDFSTFQLAYKLRELDKFDGRNSAINWNPDYLWIDRAETISLERVINGFKTGAYYEAIPKLLDVWESRPPTVDGATDAVIEVYRLMLNDNIDQVVVSGQCGELYQKAA